MKKLTEQDGQSLDMVTENLQALKEIFPEAFKENGVDFEVLRQLLGDVAADGEERFGFTWHGKKKARQIALTPSLGTLRPCTEESLDWDTTKNLFIEGDNLEVLKLLQKSYANKIKMIYIDPPYNTGNEFIYPDKFKDNLDTYLRYTGQIDDEDFKFSSNTDSSGRYHTNWLNMMYPRIKLARNLLLEDGAIFISIDDNEHTSLRMICNEIFGEENFVATLIWQKVFSPKNTAKYFSEDHDFIIVYAKRKEIWSPTLLPRTADADNRYKNIDNDPRGPWSSSDLTARNYYGEGQYTVKGPTGKEFGPGRGRYWRSNYKAFQELDKDSRVWWGAKGGNMPRLKRFLSEVKQGIVPQTLLLHKNVGNTQEAKKELLEYVNFQETENVLNSVKPTRLLRHLLKIGTNADSEDVVLDFFAGSGGLGHSVIAQNIEDGGRRRQIMVQLPEALPKEEVGLKTISDMALMRMKTVNQKLRESDEIQQEKIDIGYKKFQLDSSNIRAWNPDRNDLEQTLIDHMEHLVEGRAEEDVLYELLLKRGVDLTVPIEEKDINSKTVYSIGYGVLFACLDTTITREQVEGLAMGIIDWHKELEPASDTQVVFRDSAFDGDIAKTNMAAILEQHGIAHVRSL